MSQPKSVFITGAGRGIGYATAVQFAEDGWHVCASDISPDGLENLRGKIGPEHTFEPLNVVDDTAVTALLGTFCGARGGRLDALVNNAGVLYADHFEDISLSNHHRVLDVNIRGALNCAYAAFPYLLSAQGTLVNLGSASSAYGVSGLASYSASKFFMRGLTEALTIEWTRHGIHVCEVLPGLVATDMTRESDSSMFDEQKLDVTAEDVARSIHRMAMTRHTPHMMVDSSKGLMLRRILDLLPRFMKRRAMAASTGYDL